MGVRITQFFKKRKIPTSIFFDLSILIQNQSMFDQKTRCSLSGLLKRAVYIIGESSILYKLTVLGENLWRFGIDVTSESRKDANFLQHSKVWIHSIG